MLVNRLRVLLSLAFAAAVGVSAQTPDIDPCILSCSQNAEGPNTCDS